MAAQPEEPESEREADAPAAWGGRPPSACSPTTPHVRFSSSAAVPGRRWAVSEDGALPLAAAILRRLAKPAPGRHPFRLLGDVARWWAEELPGRWERLGRPL